MCNIDVIMNRKTYGKILDNFLTLTIKSCGWHCGGFTFQQVGDPKHNSTVTRDWLQDHHIEVMDWPVQSCDLNPFEHILEHLSLSSMLMRLSQPAFTS
jgi:hypothetical protein